MEQLGDQLLDGSLDGVRVGRRRLDLQLLEDRPRLVDHAAGDLGAADVDADRERHRSSSGQSSSSGIRSTPPSRPGWGGAIIPATASINDEAAVERWAMTSGLVWRIAATVRHTGHHVHSGSTGRDVLVQAVGERRPAVAVLLRPPREGAEQLRRLFGHTSHRLRIARARTVRLP